MIRLSSLSITASSSLLFDCVDAVLVEGDTVGLVGKNGCGKSTLLNVIANVDGSKLLYWSITSGRIERSISEEDCASVLLVKQDKLLWSHLFPGIGTEEEILGLSLTDALEMSSALGGVDEIEDEENWRKLIVEAGIALHWEVASYEDRSLRHLSPGCALRAYLAVALLRASVRVLLLDEPTNHLDLPSILWLQQMIQKSKKTFIIVSHDEAFLEGTTDRIWEVADKTLTISTSNYSAYMHAKKVALEQQRKAYENQQKRHKRLTETAEKLKAASKAGEKHQAKDHDLLQRDFFRDRAGRSGKRASAVERHRDSEAVIDKITEHAPLRLRLDPLGAGCESSIVCDRVVLGYGTTQLPLPPLTLRIDFKERVSLIGYNGVGKSTLMKTLVGSMAPLSGTVTRGRELRIGDLTQQHENLPSSQTPREYIASTCNIDAFTGGSRVISYGLSRHQVDSPISELNPGARVRLLLASFSLRKVNILVLDEPTNHLDEEAVMEVIASLNEFEGTVIIVSHDRQFLRSISVSRTYCLQQDGLDEVESIDTFAEQIEQIVERVVECVL